MGYKSYPTTKHNLPVIATSHKYLQVSCIARPSTIIFK